MTQPTNPEAVAVRLPATDETAAIEAQIAKEIDRLKSVRWVVTRSYMAEQSCEVTAEEASTPEEALAIARTRFGTLTLQLDQDEPSVSADIDVIGHAVYDQTRDDGEAVLEED